MTNLTTYCSTANVSLWCTRSPQCPLLRDPYYVNWYTHEVYWLYIHLYFTTSGRQSARKKRI